MYRLHFYVHFHNSLYPNLSYSHVEQAVTESLSHPRFADFVLDDTTVIVVIIVVIIFSKQSTVAEIFSWWILGNLGGIYRGQNTERRNGAELARKRRSTK